MTLFHTEDPLTPYERLSLLLQAAHKECQVEDEERRTTTRTRVAYLERTGWFDAWAQWCRRQREDSPLTDSHQALT